MGYTIDTPTIPAIPPFRILLNSLKYKIDFEQHATAQSSELIYGNWVELSEAIFDCSSSQVV